jgi:YgiT-type zinc finger domain-containing protein
MKCVFCGSKLKNEIVTFIYDEEDKYLFIKNVPAEVCTSCGEKTYSPSVADDLLKFAKDEFHPVKFIKVPVFNFTERV